MSQVLPGSGTCVPEARVAPLRFVVTLVVFAFFVMRSFPAPVVQRLAGHIHLSVTQRYAHTHTEDLRAAIALL